MGKNVQVIQKSLEYYFNDGDNICDFCSECGFFIDHLPTGPSYSCGGEPGYMECIRLKGDPDPLDPQCCNHDLIGDSDFLSKLIIEREFDDGD